MKKPRQIELVPPTADSRIIKRQAKLLDQQRRTLGDISMEAIKVATLQLAVKKLEEGLRLLQQAGVERATPLATPPAPLTPVVKNPCVGCGREGVYQSKKARTQGKPAPWYCQIHAAWAMQEDREEQAQQNYKPAPQAAETPAPVIAAPPPTPPKLAEAMAALQGQKV